MKIKRYLKLLFLIPIILEGIFFGNILIPILGPFLNGGDKFGSFVGAIVILPLGTIQFTLLFTLIYLSYRYLVGKLSPSSNLLVYCVIIFLVFAVLGYFEILSIDPVTWILK